MSNYGVIKFQAPFERLKDYDLAPDVRLYKAVLTQAMIDASNISKDPGAKKLELEAKEWLFGNSDYFHEICCMADIEPDFMVQIAKEAISLNFENKIGIAKMNIKSKNKCSKKIA